MEIIINQTKLTHVQGDITKQTTDAIVNAANSSLMGGGGVDGAIHRAGGLTILEQCRQIVAKQGRLPPGKAVITSGGNSPAKFVIHTVGPYWQGGTSNEAKVLASCYKESLKIAEVKKVSSISFPSISTGAFRYPLEQAAKVALEAVISFLKEEARTLKEVRFVLFDAGTFGVYQKMLKEKAI
ncbi:MAG: O-acetyl-ADP-ribose deacetylase [Dehalococcoidales bacterium]